MGATRWSVFSDNDGEWLGDIVRWMPECIWSWQPALGECVNGGYDEVYEAIKQKPMPEPPPTRPEPIIFDD